MTIQQIIYEIFRILGIVFLKYNAWIIIVILFFYFIVQNFRRKSWVEQKESTLLLIQVPKNNERGPVAAEMMFASLHGILRPKTEQVKEGSIQEHISFEITADLTSINFYVWLPKHLKDFVEGQIYAQYPMAEIKEVKDYSKELDIEKYNAITGAEIGLVKNEVFPIKTFPNFEVDPLSGITGVLSKLDSEDEKIWIQMIGRPVEDTWQKKGLTYTEEIKAGKKPMGEVNLFNKALDSTVASIPKVLNAIFSPEAEQTVKKVEISSSEQDAISAIEEKSKKLGFEIKIRVMYLSHNKTEREKIQAVIGAFKQFNTTNLNGFKAKKTLTGLGIKEFLKEYQARLFIDKGFILNIEEFASLYHLPHLTVETPNISWTLSKTAEPPANLPKESNTPFEELTLFAETNFRHHRTKFGIKTDDRQRHIYIVGKSGTGKSKLLEGLVMQDILKGNGVAVVDPNGDLFEDVLDKIPSNRVNDVILFDPADQKHPIAFNVLEHVGEEFKQHVASGFVGTMKKLFGYSWGPRLEYILNYTVLALLDYPNSTMLGIVRMLTDKNYRKRVIKQIKDPVVKNFWTTEFASYNDRFANEAIAPILNKVGQFVANPMVRNIVGQSKSTFDLREIMDNKKILLVNLATGKMGDNNSELLGGLMVTKLQLAAMSRANIPKEERINFFLYVDEFQHFATESFATILSEARKYHLCLTMANQYISQMEDSVRDAVFGNVGTMITFRVGAVDAQFLEKEFNPPFEANDIINLNRQHIYLKMSVDGQVSPAFSAKTLTISNEKEGNRNKITQVSRERYTKSRDLIEERIAKWSGLVQEEIASKKEEQEKIERKEEAENKFEAPPVVKIKEKTEENKKIAPIIKEKIQTEKKQDQGPQEKLKKFEKPIFHKTQPEIKPKEKEEKKTTVDQNKLKEAIKAIGEKIKEAEKPPAKDYEKHEKRKEKEKITVGQPKTDNPSSVKEKVKTDEKQSPKQTEDKKFVFDKDEHKKEKIVTPENFKDLKEIHPHEKVKLAEKDKNSHEIQEGETVVFKE